MDKRELIKNIILQVFEILDKKRLNKNKRSQPTPIRIYDEIVYVPATNNRVFYSDFRGDVIVAGLVLVFAKEDVVRAYTLGFYLPNVLIIGKNKTQPDIFSPSRELTLDEYLFGIRTQHLADVLVEFLEQRLVEEYAVTTRRGEYWTFRITDLKASAEEISQMLVDASLYRNPKGEVTFQVLKYYFEPVLIAGDFVGDKTLKKFMQQANIPLKEFEWMWQAVEQRSLSNLEMYLTLLVQEILAKALENRTPPKFPTIRQLSKETGFSQKYIAPIWNRLKKKALEEYKEKIYPLMQPVAYRIIYQDPFISYKEFRARLKQYGLKNEDIQSLWYDFSTLRKARRVEEWVALVSNKLRPFIENLITQGIKPTKQLLLKEIKRRGYDVLPQKVMKKALDVVLAQYEFTPARKTIVKEYLLSQLRAKVYDAIVKIVSRYVKRYELPDKYTIYKLVKEKYPQANRRLVYEMYKVYLQNVFKTTDISEIRKQLRRKFYSRLIKQYLKKLPRKERKQASARKIYKMIRQDNYAINKSDFFEVFKLLRRR